MPAVPSHSIGTVEFGPDGALYASAGEGASFNFVDYGQDGNPVNPCGDPPAGLRRAHPANARKAARCAARISGRSGDPVALDGSIIRVDPATGAALADNPLVGEPRSQRAPHHRLRVAQSVPLHVPARDERDLDRRRRLERLGGDRPHRRPDGRRRRELRLALLRGEPASRRATTLRTSRSARTSTQRPTRIRSRSSRTSTSDKVVTGESCPTGSSSLSGMAFEFVPNGSTFPAEYDGALFFADYSRRLHLGDDEERQPEAVAWKHSDVRCRRGRAGESRVRPGRIALLRRLRRRNDPADLVRSCTTAWRLVRPPDALRHRNERTRGCDRRSERRRKARHRDRQLREPTR